MPLIQPVTLIEPIFYPDVFATGFLVQKLPGGCVRLVFYTDHLDERVVVAKIIRPIPLLVASDKILRLAETAESILGLH